MMNTNKLFPFMTMRLLSEYGYTSLDEVDKPGMYVIPDAVSLYGDFSNGFLNVFVPYEGIVIQEGCRVTENAYYKRIRTLDGNWLPWQRIDNFGYNSFGELAGGVATEMGLDVLPYGYHSLTQSSPFTMNIPKNALIMVSEIYYGYHLVLFAQNAKNVVAKLSESSGSPFSVSMSNGTLIVSVSNGGYDIHVSSLSFN